MTDRKGRILLGSALRGVLPLVTAAAALSACADTAGTPEVRTSIRIESTLGPREGAPVPVPALPDGPLPAAPCSRTTVPKPPAAPPATPADDAAERARRALEAQQTPVPQRAPLPPAAVPAAEACARAVSPELTLLTAGSSRVPADDAVRAVLTRAGLTGLTVTDGRFAASTGAACLFGDLTTGTPALTLGPLPPVGPCRP